MWHMRATPDALQHLGVLVTDRRTELGLQVKPAARLAGIAYDTWKKVEDDQPVRDTTYAAIERVLRWKNGSCRNVLNGGEPIPLPDDDSTPEAATEPRLVENGDDFDVWAPVVASDLRDSVRGAMMAVMPGTTGAEIQAIEEVIEQELRRRAQQRRTR